MISRLLIIVVLKSAAHVHIQIKTHNINVSNLRFNNKYLHSLYNFPNLCIGFVTFVIQLHTSHLIIAYELKLMSSRSFVKFQSLFLVFCIYANNLIRNRRHFRALIYFSSFFSLVFLHVFLHSDEIIFSWSFLKALQHA